MSARCRLWVLCVAATIASTARGELPDKGWIVWASNRADGRHEAYLMKVDGSGVTRLTFEGGKSPIWSPDGAWIAYTATADDSTQVMRWDRTERRTLCDAGQVLWFWMHDGSGAVCGGNNTFVVVDPKSGDKTPLFAKDDFPRLGAAFWPGGISRDGRWLLGTTDRIGVTYPYDNGTFTTPINAAVILDRQDKQRIYFLGNGCEPLASPLDDLVVHVNWDSPTFPDIFHLRLRDLASRSSYAAEIAHPDADWGHEYMPRFSTDGQWLTYSATTGCQSHDECDYEVFVHRVSGGDASRTRVTTDPGSDQWAHLYVGDLWDRDRPPRLTLSTTTLRFSATGEQQVTASNGGGGTLPPLRVTATADWLSLSVTGVGNSQTITARAAVGGLGYGSYAATVHVAAAGAVDSPRAIEVALVLAPSDSGCGVGAGAPSVPLPLIVVLVWLLRGVRGRRAQLP
jgi:hypothetical protein